MIASKKLVRLVGRYPNLTGTLMHQTERRRTIRVRERRRLAEDNQTKSEYQDPLPQEKMQSKSSKKYKKIMMKKNPSSPTSYNQPRLHTLTSSHYLPTRKSKKLPQPCQQLESTRAPSGTYLMILSPTLSRKSSKKPPNSSLSRSRSGQWKMRIWSSPQ